MSFRTVTASPADVSLYHIALRELGDARHWWALAEINGLDDPMLDGVTELLIPLAPPEHLDGLPRR